MYDLYLLLKLWHLFFFFSVNRREQQLAKISKKSRFHSKSIVVTCLLDSAHCADVFKFDVIAFDRFTFDWATFIAWRKTKAKASCRF